MRIAALAGAKLQPWDGASRGTVLVLPGADLSRLPFAYPRKRVLESLGVRFTKHGARSLPDPAQTQVIALGPGAERELRTPEDVSAFRERLATRTVLALPGADLSLLPFGLVKERTTLPGGAARPEAAPPNPPVPDLPVFAGIRRDFGEFLRLADGHGCDVVAGGPAWMLATSPACFAHVKNGNSSIVVLAVAPGDVPEPARPALARVWCTILANLDVETPAGP